jgi:DNA-directed RNA polymerase subunit beta'
LASVISDCYQLLGRRATIKLLDDMNQLGFRESTRSGLSFATDDLVTTRNQEPRTLPVRKRSDEIKKLYDRVV